MSGTVEGGRKTYRTTVQKYGADFYASIGHAGGVKGTTGGFYQNRELAKIAGAKGGSMSRRRSKAETERRRQDKARYQRQLEKNYKHLLKIAKQAKKERELAYAE